MYRNVSIAVSLFWLLESLQSTTYGFAERKQICWPKLSSGDCWNRSNLGMEVVITSPLNGPRFEVVIVTLPKTSKVAVPTSVSPSDYSARQWNSAFFLAADIIAMPMPQVSAKTPVTVRLCFGEVMVQAVDMPGTALIGGASKYPLDAWDGWN